MCHRNRAFLFSDIQYQHYRQQTGGPTRHLAGHLGPVGSWEDGLRDAVGGALHGDVGVRAAALLHVRVAAVAVGTAAVALHGGDAGAGGGAGADQTGHAG